jgi:hypothetical protein
VTTIVYRESTSTATRHVSPTFGKRDGTQVLVDYSEPLPVVAINHYRLHEGMAFIAYYLQNGVSPLADGASINIAIAANAGYYPHLTVGGFCGGDSTMFIYESATASGGTAFTPINRNRNSLTTSNVAMTINPTVTSTGTELFEEFFPGGLKKKAGGGGGDALEYVIKPLTNYLIRLTNISGSAQTAEIMLEWYE